MIQRVETPGDPALEPYRHVGDPRWLLARGLFVAEGRLVVERLLAIGRYDVASIAVNAAAHRALEASLAAARSRVLLCADGLLGEVTGFNFHRGCLALVRRPAPAPATRLMEGDLLLATEGVGNPDNVGGLFRTAAAFGAAGVLMDHASGDPFYRKAVRTSMGAVLGLPFARLDPWPDALAAFRSSGFEVVALTPRAGAAPIDQFAASRPPGSRVVLLVGSEGQGLADTTMAHADAAVRIPILAAVDSLNVTVAAGIALSWIRAGRPPRATSGEL